MTVAAITAVLGGRQTLKRKVESDAELTRLTREGLPVNALTSLAREFSIDRKALSHAVGISDRTLSRRLAGSHRLSVEESDRVVRMARVLALAAETFGTKEKAALWLQSPNSVLEDQTPFSLLDTDAGVRSVETILGRIAWGIYS
jgi:putative toxin-antitoxin system antitoxin component (TIGR02293 family)